MLWSFASPLNAAHLLALRIWKSGLVSLYNQMDMYIGLGLNSREVDGFVPTLESCAFENILESQVDSFLLPVTLMY